MLTPLEIENRKFKREFSGYSKVEVEEFMNVISENYELIYKENLANKDKINMLTNAIKQYKAMEEALQNAILLAQSTGDEVVQNAKKKAENIIKDAETKAAKLLSDASLEVTRTSYEYEELKRSIEVFRTRVISLLTSQLDIVKEFSVPDKREKNYISTEAKAEELAPVSTEQPEKVVSALERLEQVTMELPKIEMNEKGEYVAVESDNVESAETEDNAE